MDRKDLDNELLVDSSMEYCDWVVERWIVFGIEVIVKVKVMVKKWLYLSDLIVKIIFEFEDVRFVKLDEISIGGVLLVKMGWSLGKGLGMDGEGRIDLIIMYVYIFGVGIGSIGNNKFVFIVEEYLKR